MRIRSIMMMALLAMVANRGTAAGNLEPGLWGEYFDMGSGLEDFPTVKADQKPVVARADKTINFESTQDPFYGTTLVDNFYVRWTGQLRVANEGKYSFFLESDDGSRLFIDGKQVIDNGGKHGMEEVAGSVQLTAGDHAVKIEFFESEIDAGCRFLWQAPGQAKQVVPAGVLFHEPAGASGGAGTGLQAEYFDIGSALEDFPKIPADKKPTLKRIDKQINFEATEDAWPGTQFYDYFFVRWTGKLRASKEGSYVLSLESDDGSRLFIDGKLVVDNGGNHHMTEKTANVSLTAGDHDLKIEYFENEVHAGCIFSWQPPGEKKEVVPTKVLFP